MAEPWIRYQPKNEGNLYQPERVGLPYSKGLDPLTGIFNTIDYLTTAPIRGGISQAQKTGPWDFFKGAYNSLRHPNSTPNATQVAKQSGLSDIPLYQNRGRVSFGGLGSKLSPADIGGFIGENVLDPSNLIPAGKAMAVGGLALGGLKKVGKELSEDLVEKGIKNNLGRPVHPTPEGQENFKKWFEGSKVVDENGQPLVVYHGTKTPDLTEFSKTKDIGYHFAVDDYIAKGMAGKTDDSELIGNVPLIEAHLNIKKPAWVPDLELWRKQDLLGDIDKWNNYAERNNLKTFNYDDNETFVDNLKRYSHQVNEMSGDYKDIDGFAYYNEYEGRGKKGPKIAYIALRPEQIKSATGNSGKFNPKDPNILKGLAPIGPWMLYQQNRRERTQNDRE